MLNKVLGTYIVNMFTCIKYLKLFNPWEEFLIYIEKIALLNHYYFQNHPSHFVIYPFSCL